jgi:hypothetical protein
VTGLDHGPNRSSLVAIIVFGSVLFLACSGSGGDPEDENGLQCPSQFTKVITVDYGETDGSSWKSAQEAVLNSNTAEDVIPIPYGARHLIDEAEPGANGLLEIGETPGGGTQSVLYLAGKPTALFTVGQLAGGGYEITGAGAC